MIGPYGGDLAADGARATERVDPALADLLAPDVPASPPAHRDLVPARGEKGGAAVSYDGDLRGLSPLGRSGGATRALELLGHALEALAALHATGRAHGDVRPAQVLGREGRAALLFPARPVDALLLLRGRLRAGAEPADVGFVAPEVLAGAPATEKSDVFSAAAIVHWLVLGRAPHGKASSLSDAPGVSELLDRTVQGALEADPGRRPALAELRAAIASAPGTAAPAPADEPLAAGEGVTLAEARRARRDTPIILGCLLFVGGAILLLGALWFAGLAWMALPDRGAGRLFFLVLLNAGAFGLGLLLHRRGFRRSGYALVVVGTQLLWTESIYLIDMTRAGTAWPVVASGLAITGITFGLALPGGGAAILATLGSLDAVVTLVALGVAIGGGSREGPAAWCGVCALGLAALSALGRAVAGHRAGVPPALVALVLFVVSHAMGLFLLDRWDPLAFPFYWPYALLAVAAGAAAGLSRLGERVYAIIALALVAWLLVLTPTVHALTRDEAHLWLYGASTIGAGVIVAGFKWPAISGSEARRFLAVLVGLVSVVAAPGFKALDRLMEHGDDLFWDALHSLQAGTAPPELLGHRLFYFPYFVGTSVVLVALGILFARDSQRKVAYRTLEISGLLLFFGTLTLLSLGAHRSFAWPTAILVGAVAALATGARERHVMLVVLASAFLVLNVAIQYFAKLWEVVNEPALVLMGFGAAILAGAVVFEKKVRPYLPALKGWA